LLLSVLLGVRVLARLRPQRDVWRVPLTVFRRCLKQAPG